MKKAALLIVMLVITVATMARSRATVVREHNAFTPGPFEPIQKPKGDELTAEFHQSYALTATGRVSIVNINGDVHISAWDRNEVKVDAVKRAYSPERFSEATIDVTNTADSVIIKTKYSERNLTFDSRTRENNPASIQYTLTVPRGVRIDGVELVNGRLDRFEKQVDDLRTLLKIPGMSAVIIKDQKVLWAKGFGFADLERRVPTTPDTVFHLASLTKTFAATLIMQLVEQGKLDLDEPISRYSSDFKDDSVKIKHIISHTSGGTPGERYQYDGNRFDYLTAVIEKKFGKPFLEVIVETFFDPLGMSSSIPFHNIVDEADKRGASLGKEHLDRYKQNLSRLAKPYTFYGDGEIIDDSYPPKDFIGAAAGLLSTVLDMARYDAAIDRHVFLKKKTQEKAWTAFTSNSGQRLPYGLGWFVTDYHGQKLIWHYGHWGTGFSAIYLKVPEKNVSLVMLANSEALADHQFQVGEDITNNVFACSFLSLWGLAYDCERNSQTALAKWIERRRASRRTAVRVDPRILETYVGEYQFETLGNRIYTFTREGDKLFFSTAAGSKTELFADSESTFFLKIRPYRFIFTKSDGQPAQLKIVEGQATYPSKRIK